MSAFDQYDELTSMIHDRVELVGNDIWHLEGNNKGFSSIKFIKHLLHLNQHLSPCSLHGNIVCLPGTNFSSRFSFMMDTILEIF
jgi:hypothetical protein